MGVLDGKTAVVTGGGRGIGRCIAEALHRAGAAVHVIDLSRADLEGIECQTADISDSLEVGRAVDRLPADVTLLVNNAGITRDRTLLKMSDEEWDQVHAVHLKGTFLATQTVARILKERGEGGRIINTSSFSGLLGNFGQSNYGAAKAGIAGFTRVAALELALSLIHI